MSYHISYRQEGKKLRIEVASIDNVYDYLDEIRDTHSIKDLKIINYSWLGWFIKNGLSKWRVIST